eukprot:2587836-Rhodomonas_salina.2
MAEPSPTPCLLRSGRTKPPAPSTAPVTTLSPVQSRPQRDRTHWPGAVPLDDVPIQQLSDSKLARALVENKVVLELPDTWWINPDTGLHQKCVAIPVLAYNEKKYAYLNAEILEPSDLREPTELQLLISYGKWNLRALLGINFRFPKTLRDIRLSARTKVLATAIRHWSALGGATSLTSGESHMDNSGLLSRSSHEWRDDFSSGPFEDPADNTVWSAHVLASAADADYLSTVDTLEPDPKSHSQAMKHPRLKPFWLKAEDGEMAGLWDRGCLRKVLTSELTEDERKHIFRSKFHYKIKCSGRTGKVTKCKASVVVLGNHMTQGKDYLDAFAPVPRTTAGRVVMALAAGGCRNIHSLDITQVFIQSEWQCLPEGNPSQIFIHPPDGVTEERGVVYEVLKPLYCIPNSALALHFTPDDFIKSQGFVAAGFEDSVWVCEPNEVYREQLIVSAHIDDLLVSCADLPTLNMFKAAFLSHFDGTDDGQLTEYLVCKVIIDSHGNLTLRQSAYVERILCTYDAWDSHSVCTPLEPGKRLTKKDSPDFVDPTLHHCYRGFVCHLSFLVQMTQPDLAFAFS